MTWHVSEEDLRAYARGELAAPLLWSADTHVGSCADCRAVLAAVSDPAALDAGWERLDAELDAPRPGPGERLLVRLGVAAHTARLLTATPVLRRSWLASVTFVLVATVLVVHAVDAPALFLALAPLLPLAAVALSYGPVLDPTYEIAAVTPTHGFRLLMIRTVAALTASLGLNCLAALALPGYGLLAFGWLLPALALTAAGLALSARLGPLLGPGLVGGAWTVLMAVAALHPAHTPAAFTTAGQSVAAALAAVATLLLHQVRDRFDAKPC
ncbi:zf-HC2 domain-containing protein [Streptomyces shenzhenensis]|uniref:zf-HC2 domain-containing protein n=1 Tax=Streptomyces shenzhenensis TaxID=943815 RepID=UPI001F2D97E6|nr:zf-HC2 domain-containing protein [Streptomyces shenzhenensis]